MKTLVQKLLFSATIIFAIFAPYFVISPRVQAGKETMNIPVIKIANNVAQASEALLNVGKPIRLIIPRINVNANVLHIGLTKDGAVGVPDGAHEVSWFDVGPRPGQKGSAVISGHYGRWKNGTDSVFNLLPTLKPGDLIYVKDDKGITRPFKVKKMYVYGKDESVPEIFNKFDNAYLNIITCHGKWLENEHTYSQRLVVFTQLI